MEAEEEFRLEVAIICYILKCRRGSFREEVVGSLVLCNLVSLCNLSCIYVGICSIGVAARSTRPGPSTFSGLAELSDPDDGESEKLDSCVTGLATSHDGEDDKDDELDSYDSWRR